MSRQYKDGNNPSVGGPACSYSNLGNYNNSTNMGVRSMNAGVSGVYVVPNYGAPGYDTLVNKNPTCSGYYTISSAYGGNDGKGCNQEYVQKLCNQ
jgi:hypothetical protein